MFNTDDAAVMLAKQMQAFDLTVIQKKSLRQAAEIMGVSHMSVKAYADTYAKALGDTRITENVETKRAKLDAELDAIKAKALAVYDYCMGEDRGAKKMPLAAVGAINSYTATIAHQRAVQGLDTPKEVKAEVDGLVRIVWDEGDETPEGYAPSESVS